MEGLEVRMGGLEVRMDRMTDDLGEIKGDALERRYRERAFAYFAPLVRRVHVVFGDELVELLAEAVEQGRLSEAEADEVGQADVIVRGRRRHPSRGLRPRDWASPVRHPPPPGPWPGR